MKRVSKKSEDERVAVWNATVDEYPGRLMAVLKKALEMPESFSNFDVFDGKFRIVYHYIYDIGESCGEKLFLLPHSLSDFNDMYKLNELEEAVNWELQLKSQQAAMSKKRIDALAKLTKEEQEILGL